jgi:hypothetical protein
VVILAERVWSLLAGKAAAVAGALGPSWVMLAVAAAGVGFHYTVLLPLTLLEPVQT